MSSGRVEMKVGLFVIVLLGLAAVMIFKFSESGLGLSDTVSIHLKTKDAGTVIENSPVLMSGVKVGYVDDIQLDLDGSVTMTLELFSKYADNIDANATFEIKSSGFLGDQYIGVIPPSLKDRANRPLPADAERPCEPPFDIMSVARDAQETIGVAQKLILDVSDRVKDLNATIANLNENVFNPETLSHIRATITNFANVSTNLVSFSKSATNVAQRVETMLTPETTANITNSIAEFNAAMENFNSFSRELRTHEPDVKKVVANFVTTTDRLRTSVEKLDKYISDKQPEVDQVFKSIVASSKKLEKITTDLDAALDNNATNVASIMAKISEAATDIKDITQSAKMIVNNLEAGKGLAGSLLKDEKMRGQFQKILGDLNATAASMKIVAKNLEEHGLLHKPKPKPNDSPRSVKPK
jgi:phospholipid/cholesterol/gamma-HCH transport system substrate-binding protein